MTALWRLLRAVAIVVSSAVVLSGAVAGLSVATGGFFSHVASSTSVPLPALDTTQLEGSTVYADDGTTVLGVFRGSMNRIPITFNQVPKVLVHAVLDTEDERFYIHGGFDIPSTIRAFASDSSANGGLQGGSTIAQQLVKNLYLNSERKISRKIKEAVIADRLERKYSKNTILDTYLNTIYLGNGAYGVEAASEEYFNETALQLTIPQAALLAGLIQDPNGYDPILHAEAARTRRSEVLGRMLHYHTINRAQEVAANNSPLPTAIISPPTAGNPITDYYVQEVETELLDGANSPLGTTYNERYNALFYGDLKIITNLNPTLQAIAQQKITAVTPTYNNPGFQEAEVSINPATGGVEAMVAGSNFNESHYNIITQGHRQAGSGFKIFTLLAALADGYNIDDTVNGTSPCAIGFPGEDGYLPPNRPATNDEGDIGIGEESVLTATAQSTNCAYLRIAHAIGLPAVVAEAHKLGVTENLGSGEGIVPSVVLGAIGVEPIEMAAAYAAVADGGVYHAPSFIDEITDPTGATIYTGEQPGVQIDTPEQNEEATAAFKAVVTSGTGTAAALPGREAAGKTGTTNGPTDAWFNGFTPQLETTVWMGSLTSDTPMVDVGDVGEVYGGTYPTETWHDIMEAYLANQPVESFTPYSPAALPPTKIIPDVGTSPKVKTTTSAAS